MALLAFSTFDTSNCTLIKRDEYIVLRAYLSTHAIVCSDLCTEVRVCMHGGTWHITLAFNCCEKQFEAGESEAHHVLEVVGLARPVPYYLNR